MWPAHLAQVETRKKRQWCMEARKEQWGRAERKNAAPRVTAFEGRECAEEKEWGGGGSREAWVSVAALEHEVL